MARSHERRIGVGYAEDADMRYDNSVGHARRTAMDIYTNHRARIQENEETSPYKGIPGRTARLCRDKRDRDGSITKICGETFR